MAYSKSTTLKPRFLQHLHTFRFKVNFKHLIKTCHDEKLIWSQHYALFELIALQVIFLQKLGVLWVAELPFYVSLLKDLLDIHAANSTSVEPIYLFIVFPYFVKRYAIGG